ncbi:hypothetical protein LAC03_11550 [Levilactobacillus acidifarinae]|nr:hypothetical protein LAC03_11550 [Levilactobacillus acidifarinae]
MVGMTLQLSEGGVTTSCRFRNLQASIVIKCVQIPAEVCLNGDSSVFRWVSRNGLLRDTHLNGKKDGLRLVKWESI